MGILPQSREIAIQVLQQIADCPELIDNDERFKSLVAKVYKQGRKANKKVQVKSERNCDRNTSEICFLCNQSFTEHHSFYPGFCLNCGTLNYAKRNQSVNLGNKIALVTGARLRIGYATVLKLLRSGATVIATTRFPNDAAKRYSRENDFKSWEDRLHIYGLDLRHLSSLESFTEHILDYYSRLDIIVNNAAQTVRRPPRYYSHLIDFETLPWYELPKDLQILVNRYRDFRLSEKYTDSFNLSGAVNRDENQGLSALDKDYNLSALLSQVNLVAEDFEENKSSFPLGKYNREGEQLDLRTFNSWLMKDDEVELLELLEVHIINAIAPFLINSRLKALMKAQPKSAKYIINVSSVEGRFNSGNKSWRHPHTNMAKAALNQMTRTCAREYSQHRIFMNAVDPGWVSYQQPNSEVQAMKQRGMKLHLDSIDGAARIYDPIYMGITEKKFLCGKLLKNYQEVNW